MANPSVYSLIACLGLAAIHIFAGKLRFLNKAPRSRWLSLAGGVAVAYVLVHLLPELAEHDHTMSEAGGGSAAERLLYFITLIGLVTFYGLEKLARRSRYEASEDDETSTGVFWIHIASFAVYNALVGYTLMQEERSLFGLGLYAIALGLHFLVNDFGLGLHHGKLYRRYGRWLTSAAVLGGWLIAAVASVPEAVTAAAAGFLAGGILLNTFKEELPEERESRFWAFGLGAAAYAGLLLVA